MVGYKTPICGPFWYGMTQFWSKQERGGALLRTLEERPQTIKNRQPTIYF